MLGILNLGSSLLGCQAGDGDRMNRTDIPAFSATNALNAVYVLGHLHTHLASSFTRTTIDALMVVHMKLEEAYPVQQPIQCPKWTEILAKWPIYQN